MDLLSSRYTVNKVHVKKLLKLIMKVKIAFFVSSIKIIIVIDLDTLFFRI